MATVEDASMDPNLTSNVAYVFIPNTKEIYCNILPRRLLEEPIYVKEIDLYDIDLSPLELLYYYGGGSDDENFYFLTILKKKTEKKYNRAVGSSGTWNNRRKDPCSLKIDGLDMIVGEKRLFNFSYSRNEDSAQDKEEGIKWIMREYAMEEGYINYLFKKHNLDANSGDLIELSKNVVFCHIYKKVDKRRRKEHVDTIVEQKRICVIEDQRSSQLQQQNNGKLTTTIDNGHHVYGELATTTMGSGHHPNTEVTNAHAHHLQFINNRDIEFYKTMNELPRPCQWIPVPYNVWRQFNNIYDA